MCVCIYVYMYICIHVCVYIYIYIYIGGWSNTVGNLNEGFRVTKQLNVFLFDFFGGTDLTHACAHFAFHF